VVSSRLRVRPAYAVIDQRLAADLLLEIVPHVRRQRGLRGRDAFSADPGKLSQLQQAGQALCRKPPGLFRHSPVSEPASADTRGAIARPTPGPLAPTRLDRGRQLRRATVTHFQPQTG
jgi:hypothetical protein